MTKAIELTQGQIAKIDDWNYEYYNQWGWYAYWNKHTQSFYARRNEGKRPFIKIVHMHREIANTPIGMICDHKDHDTLNNQDENLRNVTHSQNSMNRRMFFNNQLGEKCISMHHNKFRVHITVDGKCVFRKNYSTFEEAIIARDEAFKKYHGEFAYLQDGK